MRFGLVCYIGLTPQRQGHIEVWFGLLGLNASATARVILRFGLVCYIGLTPQQQPGSY